MSRESRTFAMSFKSNSKMNNEAIQHVCSELEHAGEDSRELQLLQRLEERRITPEKEIPPMQFLFQMFCKPCFPRGELVAVAGKAKSGKTFVCSILMTLCFREEVLTVRRLEDTPLSVLWFDTEQSEESTQDILNHRIMPMTGMPDFPLERFHIFNVRADLWQERLPLLEVAMRRFQPDLVILDGIRDLVNDINDGVMAQDVIERLMHIASEQHCCLVSILHQNKSLEDKNLRGWIGTELKNKAFEVYECSKDADRIFTWSQTDTRKYDIIDKLKYTVGEDGIPQLCSVEQLMETQAYPSLSPDGRPSFSQLYFMGYEDRNPLLDVERLFIDAFQTDKFLAAYVLQERVMKLANITSYRFYNRQREAALQSGLIVPGKDRNDHIIYILKRQKNGVPSDGPC